MQTTAEPTGNFDFKRAAKLLSRARRLKTMRDYKKKNFEKVRQISIDWKIDHPERTRELSRKSAAAFFKKHPDRVRENARRSVYHRLATDPGFRVLQNIRRRLHKMLTQGKKVERTIELVGCSVAELMAHLESTFTEGMSWKNYGAWHVDHIKPCAKFDFNIPLHRKVCFHYSNLQALWAKENLSKSDN